MSLGGGKSTYTLEGRVESSGVSEFQDAISGAESSVLSFKGAVGAAGGALVAASAGGIVKSVGAFASFDKKLTESTAIMDDVSGAMEEKLGQTARDVAADLGMSSDKAAESYYYLASAGLDATESMEAMPAVAEFAAAGQIEMAEATDYATDAAKAFQIPADNLTRVTDSMTAAVTRHNQTMEGMGTAMSYVAPVAEGLGMSIEETSAAIGMLGDAGIKGSKAGTTLRQALNKLSNPTNKMQEKLGELGVKVQDSSGQMRDFSAILSDLKSAGADTADIMELFGARAGPGMQVLLEQGGKAIESEAEKIKEMGGITEEVAKKQLDTLSKKWDKFTTKLQNVAITIGGQLAPALGDILEWATKAVDWFSQINKETDGMAGTLGLLGGVVAGLTGTLWAFIGGPITLLPALLAGAGAAASGFTVDLDSLLAKADNAGQRIMSGLGAAFSWLKSKGIPRAQTAFENLINGALAGFDKLSEWLPPRVRGAIEAGEQWLRDEGMPLIRDGLSWLAEQALAGWSFTRENVVPPVREAIAAAEQWVRNKGVPLLKKGLEMLGRKALQGLEYLRTEVYPLIRQAITAGMDWIQTKGVPMALSTLRSLGRKAAQGFQVFKREILPIIVAGINAGIDWVVNKGIPLAKKNLKTLAKAAGTAFSILKNQLLPFAIEAVRAIMSWTRTNGVPLLRKGLKFLAQKAADAFTYLKQHLPPLARQAIDAMVLWVRNSGVPLARQALDFLARQAGNAFAWLQTNLPPVINDAVSAAIDWVRTEGVSMAERGLSFLAEQAGVAWDAIKDIVGQAIQDAISAVQTYLRNQATTDIKNAFRALGSGVRTVLTTLFSMGKGLGGVIATFITDTLIPYLKNDAAGDLKAGAEVLFTTAIDVLKAIFTMGAAGTETIGGVIKGTIDAVVTYLRNDAVGDLVGAIQFIIDGIVAVFEGLYEGLIGRSLIPELFTDIADFVRTFDLASAAKELLDTVITKFEDFVSSIIGNEDSIVKSLISDNKSYIETGAKSDIKSAFETLGSAISEAMGNAADAAITSFNETMPDSISVPEVTIGGGGVELPSTTIAGQQVGGGSLRIPQATVGGQSIQIPELDTGGLIEEAGLAMLHAGEQVVPAADVDRSGGGEGGTTVTFERNSIVINADSDADGRELGREFADELSAELNTSL